MLVEYGADVNAPDLQGNTPLHYATSYGKLQVRAGQSLAVSTRTEESNAYRLSNCWLTWTVTYLP